MIITMRMENANSFHSEIKIDMDVKRLPSGKFDTNELVLELTILTYNILRMIGQETIGRRTPKKKRDVRRHRIRTVISNLVMMACHVTAHARSSSTIATFIFLCFP